MSGGPPGHLTLRLGLRPVRSTQSYCMRHGGGPAHQVVGQPLGITVTLCEPSGRHLREVQFSAPRMARIANVLRNARTEIKLNFATDSGYLDSGALAVAFALGSSFIPTNLRERDMKSGRTLLATLVAFTLSGVVYAQSPPAPAAAPLPGMVLGPRHSLPHRARRRRGPHRRR